MKLYLTPTNGRTYDSVAAIRKGWEEDEHDFRCSAGGMGPAVNIHTFDSQDDYKIIITSGKYVFKTYCG